MKHPEFDLQVQCCKWLNENFKDVLYYSDTVASVKLTVFQGARNKRIQKDGFKTPDILILKPNYYHAGLFIELKVKSPYKKDGTLLKDSHLEGQQRSINDLNKLGYFATFCVGFEEFKEIVSEYMLHVLE